MQRHDGLAFATSKVEQTSLRPQHGSRSVTLYVIIWLLGIQDDATLELYSGWRRRPGGNDGKGKRPQLIGWDESAGHYQVSPHILPELQVTDALRAKDWKLQPGLHCLRVDLLLRQPELPSVVAAIGVSADEKQIYLLSGM